MGAQAKYPSDPLLLRWHCDTWTVTLIDLVNYKLFWHIARPPVKRAFCLTHRSTAKRWSTSVRSPPWTARRPWGAGSRFAFPTSVHGRLDPSTVSQGLLTTGRFTIHHRSTVIPEMLRYEKFWWPPIKMEVTFLILLNFISSYLANYFL